MSAIQGLQIRYQLHGHSWHVSYTDTADTVSAIRALLT